MWRPHIFFRPSDLPFTCGLPCCIIRLKFCVMEATVRPTCTAHDATCAAIGPATSCCSDNSQHVSIIKYTLSLCLYHTDSTASFRYEHQSWLEGTKLRGWMEFVSYCCPILTKLDFFFFGRSVQRESNCYTQKGGRTNGHKDGHEELEIPFRMRTSQK
jgi:hypothetical protein